MEICYATIANAYQLVIDTNQWIWSNWKNAGMVAGYMDVEWVNGSFSLKTLFWEPHPVLNIQLALDKSLLAYHYFSFFGHTVPLGAS